MKRVLWAVLAALSSSWLSAQSLVGEPEFIRVQRALLDSQRAEVMAVYQKEAQICWQKFAVNACVSDARKIRRAALEPLRQKELLLNAQERQWRIEQRELRLQGKPVQPPTSP
jgi:hypothetical protein